MDSESTACAAGDRDGTIIAVRRNERDNIRIAVADGTARSRREIDIDPRHPCAGQIADNDVIGTAESIHVDDLDAIEIYRDAADIARQPHALTIGRDVDVLAYIGAVEHQRVGAGLALDRVAAVARIPDEAVVTGAQQRHVVATPTGNCVVTVTAEQHIVALAARDGVVTSPTIDGERNDTSGERAGIDRVVATK